MSGALHSLRGQGQVGAAPLVLTVKLCHFLYYYIRFSFARQDRSSLSPTEQPLLSSFHRSVVAHLVFHELHVGVPIYELFSSCLLSLTVRASSLDVSTPLGFVENLSGPNVALFS
jgi:hypothetical protein